MLGDVMTYPSPPLAWVVRTRFQEKDLCAHHPHSTGAEHGLCEQHPGSHRHLARAGHVRDSSGKIPGTAEDGGSPDLPRNLSLLHIILLTSDCLLTRCWQAGRKDQGAGVSPDSCQVWSKCSGTCLV